MININRLNQNNNYNLGNPKIDRKYSSFLMRETNQSSGNVGKIIPFFWHECQPSEVFRAYSNVNIEFTPWITNILHEINAEITYNFVPYRIIWEDWKKFITRCDEENDDTGGTLEIPLPNYHYDEIIVELAKKKNNDLVGYINGNFFAKPNDSTAVYDRFVAEYGSLVSNLNAQEMNHLFAKFMNTLMKKENPNLEEKEKSAFAKLGKIASQEFLKETIVDYAGISINFTEDLVLGFLSKYNINEIGEAYPQRIEKRIKLYQDCFINKLNFWAYNKIYNDWIRLLDWEERRDKDDLTCATENKAWDIYTKMRRYQIRGAMPTVPVDFAGGITAELNHLWKDPQHAIQGGNATNFNNANGTAHVGNQSTGYNTFENHVLQNENFTGGGEWEIQSMMSAAALMNYFVSNAKIKPRYAEQLLARWGVQIQDSRFQYAQMIGAHRVVITQDGITQTAPQVGESTLQGNITGQGWGSGNGEVKFYAPEHGVIIGCLCVKPSNVYELGIQKMWQHENTFDYPTPEFVDLPDQPIKALELSTEILEANNITIGYKSIYDEYRTKVNRVTGRLRPSLNDGLKAHTLAINYGNTLKRQTNGFIKTLVKADFPMDRIKQFIDEPDFMFISAVNIDSTQPLPAQNDVRIRI